MPGYATEETVMHPATSYELAKARIVNLRHQRVVLDGSSLTCADVDRVARLAAPVQLSSEPAVRERVARACDMVAAAVPPEKRCTA
jgi:hypothetical protein